MKEGKVGSEQTRMEKKAKASIIFPFPLLSLLLFSADQCCYMCKPAETREELLKKKLREYGLYKEQVIVPFPSGQLGKIPLFIVPRENALKNLVCVRGSN